MLAGPVIEEVYTTSGTMTSVLMREKAEELGYRRVFGIRFRSPGSHHAEQQMLNAVDAGELGDVGKVAPSRKACPPSRQDCEGRFNSYPNIRLVDFMKPRS